MIYRSRDEYQLAGVLERLAGRWRFLAPGPVSSDEAAPVDVAATNEALVLRGQHLADFRALAPQAPGVPPLADLVRDSPLDPKDVAVVLLCGGLGTRSGGAVHPLLTVNDPRNGRKRALLDLHLERLAGSALRGASVMLLGSLLNEVALREHLTSVAPELRPELYTAGLAPRLALNQLPTGPLVLHQDPISGPSYNPTGHLDALRWLVVGGQLGNLRDRRVVVVLSYSNVGHVYGPETLALGAFAVGRAERDPGALFTAEVVARPSEKATGSVLAVGEDRSALRLVKGGYGTGKVARPGPWSLMSTNTLYFPLEAVWQRLIEAAAVTGLSRGEADVVALLRAAALGRDRAKACDLFDAAFDIDPVLNCKQLASGVVVLQAERDLDQLSLLPGPVVLSAVEVGPDRAVSVKLPSDLQNPEKQRYLFDSVPT